MGQYQWRQRYLTNCWCEAFREESVTQQLLLLLLLLFHFTKGTWEEGLGETERVASKRDMIGHVEYTNSFQVMLPNLGFLLQQLSHTFFSNCVPCLCGFWPPDAFAEVRFAAVWPELTKEWQDDKKAFHGNNYQKEIFKEPEWFEISKINILLFVVESFQSHFHKKILSHSSIQWSFHWLLIDLTIYERCTFRPLTSEIPDIQVSFSVFAVEC